jgi:hypothetical protein
MGTLFIGIHAMTPVFKLSTHMSVTAVLVNATAAELNSYQPTSFLVKWTPRFLEMIAGKME